MSRPKPTDLTNIPMAGDNQKHEALRKKLRKAQKEGSLILSQKAGEADNQFKKPSSRGDIRIETPRTRKEVQKQKELEERERKRQEGMFKQLQVKKAQESARSKASSRSKSPRSPKTPRSDHKTTPRHEGEPEENEYVYINPDTPLNASTRRTPKGTVRRFEHAPTPTEFTRSTELYMLNQGDKSPVKGPSPIKGPDPSGRPRPMLVEFLPDPSCVYDMSPDPDIRGSRTRRGPRRRSPEKYAAAFGYSRADDSVRMNLADDLNAADGRSPGDKPLAQSMHNMSISESQKLIPADESMVSSIAATEPAPKKGRPKYGTVDGFLVSPVRSKVKDVTVARSLEAEITRLNAVRKELMKGAKDYVPPEATEKKKPTTKSKYKSEEDMLLAGTKPVSGGRPERLTDGWDQWMGQDWKKKLGKWERHVKSIRNYEKEIAEQWSHHDEAANAEPQNQQDAYDTDATSGHNPQKDETSWDNAHTAELARVPQPHVEVIDKGLVKLLRAIQSNDVDCVRSELATLLDVNSRWGWMGETALHDAANRGYAPICNLLLSAGADPNAQDNCGGTPLHIACAKGHTDIVEAMLSKGGDLNKHSHEDKTPLDYAIDYNRVDLVEKLSDRLELNLGEENEGEVYTELDKDPRLYVGELDPSQRLDEKVDKSKLEMPPEHREIAEYKKKEMDRAMREAVQSDFQEKNLQKRIRMAEAKYERFCDKKGIPPDPVFLQKMHDPVTEDRFLAEEASLPLSDIRVHAMSLSLRVNHGLKILRYVEKPRKDENVLIQANRLNGLGRKTFTPAVITAMANTLKMNKTLKVLDLRKNEFTDSMIRPILKAFAMPDRPEELSDEERAFNKDLTSLDISHNSLGMDAVKILSELLKKQSIVRRMVVGRRGKEAPVKFGCGIRWLDVTHNPDTVTLSAANEILDGLRQNRTLTHLAIQATPYTQTIEEEINKFGRLEEVVTEHTGGGEAMYNVLMRNDTIRSLKIIDSKIRVEPTLLGIVKRLTEVSCPITSLNMTHNYIGPAGAKLLGKAMRDNISIVDLNVAHNDIDDESGAEFVQFLQVNRTVTSLNLSNNKIGNQTAYSLVKSLEFRPSRDALPNNVLTNLNLSATELGEDAGHRLKRHFENHNNLLELGDLSRTLIPISISQFLAQKIRLNQEALARTIQDKGNEHKLVKLLAEKAPRPQRKLLYLAANLRDELEKSRGEVKIAREKAKEATTAQSTQIKKLNRKLRIINAKYKMLRGRTGAASVDGSESSRSESASPSRARSPDMFDVVHGAMVADEPSFEDGNENENNFQSGRSSPNPSGSHSGSRDTRATGASLDSVSPELY